MELEEQAPGKDAIDEAVGRVYGGRAPEFQYSCVPGEDPLDGIRVYQADGHWHFVTYGLSELYEKETSEADVSGFGFELTFRLRRGPEAEPPTWAIDFLQNLARYVFETGNVLDVNHQLHLGKPIARGEDTRMEAIVLARDPELPRISTPYGRLDFLQVVGVTADEYELLKDWGTEQVLAELAIPDNQGKMLVTDLHRPSLLDDPVRAAALRARVDQEGSSLGGVFVEHATFIKKGEKLTLELGAAGVDDVLRMLKGRTSFGREFFVRGDAAVVWVRPGERASAQIHDDELVVVLDRASAEQLRGTLQPKRGSYRVAALPGLTIQVVPSELRDREGKVVRVFG